MKKYFLQRKQDNSIAMVSGKRIKYDKNNFNLLVFNVTKQQERHINAGSPVEIKKGKLDIKSKIKI